MSAAATASSSTANAYAILGAPRLQISSQIANALAAAIPPNPTINDLTQIVVGNKRISPHSDEDSDSTTPPSSACTSTPPSLKRLRLGNSNIPKAKVTTLRDLCVAAVVSADLPFSHFENAYLQQVLQYHSMEIANEVPWGHTSIRDRLDDICRREEGLLMAELHSAASKIHLSFDLWSSPNIYAFMAVTCHFIDDRGALQSRLLAFRQHHGNHSGVALSETLINVVDRYRIRDQIGAAVSDNATTNDSCLRAFYRNLDPEMTETDVKARRMRCYGHILNLAARAFLFGADKGTPEAESDCYQLTDRHEEDLELWRKIGPVGRLRNIVKFIRSSPQRHERYRKASADIDGDSEDFRIFSESRREALLILNNEARWNSTYLMIQRAIEKKMEIQSFILSSKDDADVKQHIPEADLLSPDDWKVLAEIGMILEPFYRQTKRREGWGVGDGHGRLWEVTMGTEYLLSHLLNWKTYYKATISPFANDDLEDHSQQSRSRSGRGRRRQFRIQALPTHVHEDWASPASRLASRFDSLDERWQVFLRSSIEQTWQKLWEYYDGLTDYFNKWYRKEQLEDTPAGPEAMPARHPVDPGARSDDDVHFRQWVNSRRRRTPPRIDELDVFLRRPPEAVNDPVMWWLRQSETFPALYRLAVDVFAVPAMSADCERAFSWAKLTLTSQRLAMSPSTIESLQLAKNWLKRGVVLPSNNFGLLGSS
ncbi:putative AC transposase [Colletotrichum siamense]|uniref:putative AC transposase n=1 Tax=Colletotrichum siamense TaxID=690259 RepID=UPI0018722AA5|nr:putative AC transposase [Colletotrichum siamense]KAF5482814.1 putative AC transposase [Colletotrichum siamense]